MTPHHTDVSPPEEALILKHMALVGHIVRETIAKVPAHVDRDDLSSAGFAALVQAARVYDATRGVPFAGYAATRIRGAIVDELRSIDWASRSVRRRAREVDTTRNSLATALGRPPSNTEVASATGLSVEEISANADDVARAQVFSLQASEDGGLAESLASTLPSPEGELIRAERLTYLTEAVAELPERLRLVVEQYFLNERPMAEIAATLGVSESRVSQIRAEALVLLRDALHRELEPELASVPDRPQGCAATRREAYFAAVADRHAAGLRRPAPVGLRTISPNPLSRGGSRPIDLARSPRTGSGT